MSDWGLYGMMDEEAPVPPPTVDVPPVTIIDVPCCRTHARSQCILEYQAFLDMVDACWRRLHLTFMVYWSGIFKNLTFSFKETRILAKKLDNNMCSVTDKVINPPHPCWCQYIRKKEQDIK
jgi:hypothetical protein